MASEKRPESSTESEEDDMSMSEVIALINKLQDVATSSNLDPTLLDLPQMAVVGEQSAGKSSVLENIVGKEFLPRGAGIVTRCPLVLQLIHHDQEYGEFLHNPNTKYSDFQEIKREIQKQTDRQAGNKKAISEKPINLKIYSPHVPHLTLIDLPGLTKNPVDDQPSNIQEIIQGLILNYIKQENTLILAVTTATQDLANSDALNLAKLVDPKRTRTIGVITKLDMMDEGTDARAILENKVIPLIRGYIGLINRSQDDIDKNRDIRSAQERERRFFRSHRAYRNMADRIGSKYLRDRLSEQLCSHIKEKLPRMRAQVKKEHNRVKQNLDAMNAFQQQTDDKWQQPKIIELIQKFTAQFKEEIEGHTIDVDGNELNAGAKLNDCFYTQIYPLLNQNLYTDKKELFKLWRNMVGFRNMMFFTQDAFDNIIKKFLQQYKEPLQMSAIVAATLIKNAVTAALCRVEAYPYLKNEVSRLLFDEISRNEENTKLQLLYHIKAQKSFMNIYHPDFIKQINDNADRESNDEMSTTETAVGPKLARSDSFTSVIDTESVMGDDTFSRRHEVQRGNINVHSSIPPTKTYFFLLTVDKLAWFKDDYDSRPRGTIALDGLKISLMRRQGRTKRYILERPSSGRKSETTKLIISFKKESDEEEWLEAFHRLGIIITSEEGPNVPESSSWHTLPNKSPGLNRKPSEQTQFDNKPTTSEPKIPVKADQDPRKNFNNDPVLEEVLSKLIAYIRIIDETVHDLTPKYISYFLIHKTVKYTNLTLLSDIQKEDVSNLMQVSDEELSKRDEYFKIYNATEHALKIMGEVSGVAVKEKGKSNKENRRQKPRQKEVDSEPED